MIISLPVQTAVCSYLPNGAPLVFTGVQRLRTDCTPAIVVEDRTGSAQMIISCPSDGGMHLTPGRPP